MPVVMLSWCDLLGNHIPPYISDHFAYLAIYEHIDRVKTVDSKYPPGQQDKVKYHLHFYNTPRMQHYKEYKI